ncbi:MAG: hypothetical protein HY301_15240 [Verrucomicrobia bacterium]|nr:hypothetical protein [Verrucomicrobiota bacterium]
MLAAVLLVLLLAGCATATKPAQPFRPPAGMFPANGLVTQRGVLTALGRQFPLNGYLALSESGGRRLIVTENFGKVMADVLVKPDGKIFVMQSSRAFPPKWIRRHVAADLECLLGTTPATADCPVRMVGTNHFVVERRWYSLDLRTVETRPGPQKAEFFDETRAETK